MAVQIQLRRDTAANWTSNNPTLASGEMGIETDTNKCKVGDGTTAWNALGYFFVGSGLGVTDDGTYYVVSFSGTDLFKIRKSDKQFMIPAGLDTDVTL